MEREHSEALAEKLCELLGRHLVEELTPDKDGQVKATAATGKLALDYIKHHGITDNPDRPGSPVRELEDAMSRAPLPPFPSPEDDNY